MPKTATQITSWSYSRYAQWKECPAKAKYRFLDKLEEPKGEPMERGIAIHKKAEDYTLKRIDKLPVELKKMKKQFEGIRAVKGVGVELEVAFTKDWVRCDWRDWNNARVRIKIDAVLPPTKDDPTALVIDHKTGKIKMDYFEQVELYALTGLMYYPQAEYAYSELWFIDHGIIVPDPDDAKLVKETTFARKDVPRLKKQWTARVEPMLKDTAFRPKPGYYCKWCHFRKDNGGPCKF